MGPVLNKCPQPITWQWYRSIGDVIEINEICSEVFEGKEVVSRNGKDLAHAKSKYIVELLLYPEFSNDRVVVAIGCGAGVDRPVLRKQGLRRNL